MIPRTLLAALLLAPLQLAPRPAHAASGAICNQPDVLDLVQQHFEAQYAHGTLLRGTAAEISTDGTDVLCSVDLRVSSFDAALIPLPQIVVEQRSFTARRLEAGLRVDFNGQ